MNKCDNNLADCGPFGLFVVLVGAAVYYWFGSDDKPPEPPPPPAHQVDQCEGRITRVALRSTSDPDRPEYHVWHVVLCEHGYWRQMPFLNKECHAIGDLPMQERSAP